MPYGIAFFARAIASFGRLRAIAAFELAASLERDNVAHWLALGRVQMGREDAITAWRAFDAVLSLKPDDIVTAILSEQTLRDRQLRHSSGGR
jgi:predicted TPR repeat methyltransferase